MIERLGTASLIRSGKAKRGVYLTDGVWDRLQYEVIRRRTTVSAIAGDVLDRNLPRFKVEREG
jgi:hypothetical protein